MIKYNFVTFEVAFAPTEQVSEGQKAKYMVAVNRTVPSMSVRNYVFVLTDAIARKGRRGKGGGEANSSMLGANDRDVLNINVKLCLGSQKTTSSLFKTRFFAPPNLACPTRSKASTAARDKHVWSIS